MKKGIVVFAGIVAALVAYAANVISAGLRVGAEPSVSWVVRLPDAARRVVTWPPSWSWEPRDLVIAAGAAVFTGLLIAAWAVTQPQRSGEEHGSARWGKPRDLKPFMDPDIEKNVWLTREHRLRITRARKPEHQRNLNILCIGGSGAGKSRFFVMPNLARGLSSVVVTDPKGELLRECRPGLEQAGFQVRVLNLIDFSKSDGFNPLAYLRPGHEPEDVALLVRTIIANTSAPGQKPSGGDPFWERAEAAVLNALIAFVAATAPPEKQNLGEVMDLLSQMQASKDDALSPVDELFLQAGEFATESELLTYALSQYRVYQQAASKTAASILVTAGARLAPLHIPAIRRILASDTLALDRVGQEKTAIFAVISDSNKQFAWLSALMFSMFFQRSVWLADQQPSGMLPVPVTCWLDEFANIGRIPDFEITMATVRSRGISVVLVVQALGQGKALYQESWPTITGNCDTTLFLGSQDAETLKWITAALGKQTIRTVDASISHGRRGGGSRNVKTIARDLLSADEVGRLPGDQALVLIRGLPPFRGKKLRPLAEGRHTTTKTRKEVNDERARR
ncbi:MAG: type IV secretory system conjugative DNA transfer family protein [Propionibacteriaceae bacterium]|nr:type IV secretory system conjugative DNA transfer family protein [Propionibacteriaceae bacterium]